MDIEVIMGNHSQPSTQRSSMPELVCLFGLDGSGKTTAAKRLVESLREDGVEAVYSHPKLGMHIWTPESVDNAVPRSEIRERGMQGEKGRIGDRLLAYLLIMENWLTIQLKIRRQIAKGRVVVAERYWPDSLVDLVVDFGLTFERAKKMAALLQVSASSEYFLMDAPIHVVLERKPGPYSSEYLAKREAVYRRLASETGATIVDTQKDLNLAVSQMLDELSEGRGGQPRQQG